MLTIFERSEKGRRAFTLPTSKIKDYPIPTEVMTQKETILPEVSEIDIVRHYTELSGKAFGVDNGFYPLGSCTMKYNPKINEAAASLDGFILAHPLSEESYVQGTLELLYKTAERLKAITGMDEICLQPAAGAHGEYLGLKLIKAYHEDRKDTKRVNIIVPDSAHGTNPASATLCGFNIINIPSYADGSVNLEALALACNDTVAGLMLTNPNTLGKFDKNIIAITNIVHNAGGLCYYDGANLNAVIGIVRPGDMGFDVIHTNLHKTFSTPHGGGGPGSGPVGVKAFLKDFLPDGEVAFDGKKYSLITPKKTIGKVKAFYGNIGVIIKAYTYMLILGREGIKDAAEKAVLNANYLKALLKDIDYKSNEHCMHEFVLSMEEIKKEYNVSALDIAKAMIDHGMHPPTMYFPLIVHEALMFEPTETENKQTLDNAAKIVLEIVAQAKKEPEKMHFTPYKAYISRPDEVQAARNPILKI
ncbi:glycine dehydrogenase subunit 2 [bacterium]|nr:glycine dehydrogenase subunit 2 [bacterium]